MISDSVFLVHCVGRYPTCGFWCSVWGDARPGVSVWHHLLFPLEAKHEPEGELRVLLIVCIAMLRAVW